MSEADVSRKRDFKTPPKLKYPLDSRGQTEEVRMAMLAYDILYRIYPEWSSYPMSEDAEQRKRDWILANDVQANFSTLGQYIEDRFPEAWEDDTSEWSPA
jgi:hypothetical protein